uniref:Reverse transcriptase n=1 Tax=Strongyloides venezuelensis TaxID=75913 RepID=A0A0K0FSW8_STRVS
MNWSIGVGKIKQGLYSESMGKTTRQRKYLAKPIVDRATFEFSEELKFVDPIVDGRIVIVNEEKRDGKRKKYIPVAFAIMKEKSKSLYELLFQIIKKRFKKLRIQDIPPVIFLIDKEKAVVVLIDKLYPGHTGCVTSTCINLLLRSFKRWDW